MTFSLRLHPAQFETLRRSRNLKRSGKLYETLGSSRMVNAEANKVPEMNDL